MANPRPPNPRAPNPPPMACAPIPPPCAAIPPCPPPPCPPPPCPPPPPRAEAIAGARATAAMAAMVMKLFRNMIQPPWCPPRAADPNGGGLRQAERSNHLGVPGRRIARASMRNDRHADGKPAGPDGDIQRTTGRCGTQDGCGLKSLAISVHGMPTLPQHDKTV